MNGRVLALGILAAAGMVQAQTTAVPKFDVVSVKPCRADDPSPGGRSGGGANSPARLSLRCNSVRDLVESAFNFHAGGKQTGSTPLLEPMEGGPAWIKSDRFTIDAVAEGHPGVDMMTGPMLQALLEDRFQLKVHREMRDVSVYALRVAKGGAKLTPHVEGSCVMLDPSLPPGPPAQPFCGRAKGVKKDGILTVQFRRVTVEEFARNLGVNSGPQILGRPVVNRTGIPGVFDIDVTFSPDESNPTSLARGDGARGDGAGGAGATAATPAVAADPGGGPSIFTALQEQLGLRLESARGSQEVLVVDRVERPSEN